VVGPESFVICKCCGGTKFYCYLTKGFHRASEIFWIYRIVYKYFYYYLYQMPLMTLLVLPTRQVCKINF
jgi:hypothetical protein